MFLQIQKDWYRKKKARCQTIQIVEYRFDKRNKVILRITIVTGSGIIQRNHIVRHQFNMVQAAVFKCLSIDITINFLPELSRGSHGMT